MKRIISIILVAVLCIGVLTGCQVLDQVKDLIGLGQPDVVAGPSVDDAAEYLHKIYKDKKAETAKDFDVVGVVVLEGVKFPVTWTCDDDSIVIRESTKTGYLTVDLPDVNDTAFDYTLTATVSDAEGNKASKSYTFTVPAINNTGIVTELEEGVAYKIFLTQGNMGGLKYYALNTTQNNENKFINTTTDPKAGVEFFAEKADGGYKIYTLVDGVKNYIYANVTRTENDDGTVKYSKFIGFSTENSSVLTYKESMGGTWTVSVFDIDWGIGTYNSFTTISVSEGSYFTADKVGSSQFVIQFIDAAYANTLEEDKLPEADDDAKAILEQLYALADGESATGNFQLTGKITELDSYNNPTIVVEGYEDMPVYCYRLSVEAKVGDTITVSATQMKNYSGTYEFMNCTLVSSGNQGGNPDTPSGDLGIVTNPEIGKAYKFGLYHGNEKATVYFNGQNYNNYAWYLAYAANGIDVYLEAVEGVADGYRLYFMNGDAKTYVVAFPRDGDTTKGTLKFDTTCPTEYFTFSTEHNTLIYTSVTGEQFYLGSSGTYKSISCSAISYITNADSYVSHLYAEGATGEEAPHTHEFVNGKCACGEVDPDYVAPDMPTDGVYTIPQVLAAAEGTEVIVTGTVESFYYDWDDSYGNCSVYIVDEAGNKLLCFRLKTKVAVGDNITVTGTVAVYNGTNQLGAGCTATINGSDSGSDDPVDPNPPAGGEMTIPEVLASAEGTAVKVKGTVSEIYQAWNSQYNNISFYIVDAAGNRLLVFRTGTLVEIGDQVTVTGTATLYNEVVQIAQGGVTVIDVKHVCSDFNAADCLNAATCKVCGKVNGEAAGHNYVNGTCSACGATQVSGETITASKTMAELITELGWTSSTTKQSFNLDDNVSVKINGGNNTGKAYNGDHIRIYATDSPAGTITISVAEGCELVSIKVTTQTGTYAFLCVDGTTEDISNDTVSVSGSSVTLNSVKNGSDGKQVRVMAIEVVYAEK